MLVRYWQPWQEIETLRRQSDDIFDSLAPSKTEQSAWAPAVELKDAENALVLRAQFLA